MTKMSINYLGELRTEATHLQSGNKLITDAPKDNHGKGEAFSPTDLLATSLAACMISIMGINANKNNFSIEGTTAEIEKIMASNPRRVEEVKIIITMGKHHYTDEQKKMLKVAALNCPVALSLRKELKQTIEFVWD